jgi:SAM-dependent methyltransferase
LPRNWDEHYADPAHRNRTPEPLLVELVEQLQPGRALDLACGTGRNAAYLHALGWQVTAVDNSRTAIEVLRQDAPGVDAVLADLERHEFPIEPDSFDLICDFFYLQRDLFPAIRAGVRPGGTFAAVIHLVDRSAAAPPHNPAFLLESGELRQIFAGWKIAFYSAAAEPARSRRAARLIARRA